MLTPTLALTSFAATTPAHWRIEYWDENLLHGRPPRAYPADRRYHGASHFRPACLRARRLVSRRGIEKCPGRLARLSCPDECAPHADALALGDGVQLWPRSCVTWKREAADHATPLPIENHYCDDPAPRRSILPRRSFLTTASLIATRGCHNRCDFCYLATDGLRMPYRMKRPEQIVYEFQANGQPYAVFIDNNLGSRPDYLHSLCAALRPSKKSGAPRSPSTSPTIPSWSAKWHSPVARASSSASNLLSDDNLLAARKKTPKTADYARRLRILHDHGIQVNGSFVLGFDHDRKDVFTRTAQWIEENRLECATFHILTPYPATPLFRQMEAQGRLLHRDGRAMTPATLSSGPSNMTPEELEQGYAWMLPSPLLARSIWRRRPQQLQAYPALSRHVVSLQTL